MRGQVVVRRVDLGTGRHDLVDPVQHVLAQLHVRARQQVIELLRQARADQDGGHRRVGPDERGGQMGERSPASAASLVSCADGLLPGLIGRDGQVESLRRERGAVAPGRVRAPGQPAAGQRPVGQHPHAVALRDGQHAAFDGPVDASSTAAARCGSGAARPGPRPSAPPRSARPGTSSSRSPVPCPRGPGRRAPPGSRRCPWRSPGGASGTGRCSRCRAAAGCPPRRA